jgi:hypothetical protein
LTFQQRFVDFNAKNTLDFENIVVADTFKVNSEEDVEEFLQEFTKDGYEGIILRNSNGLYKNSRSFDLQKYKRNFDGEFKIVDFKQGDGVEKGCVVWICENENGSRFSCRPKGTRQQRSVWFLNGQDFVGKMLNVQYQELTDNGIPRFPVGNYTRQIEDE